VAHSWRAPRRSPWRGEAPEGFAQLKVALPSSPISAPAAIEEDSMARVIIGMDPHKRSATIEIINDREKVLAQGRFGTDTVG
jgi:hypothetical protein